MRYVVLALFALTLTAQPAHAIDVEVKQGPEKAAGVQSAPKIAKPPVAKKSENAAAQVVSAFYEKLQSVMNEGDTLGFQGRFERLKPAIDKAFNMQQMTRFSVGPSWYKTTKADQAKLTAAFADFSAANYAYRFKKSSGEQFIVVGEKLAAGGSKIVETKLLPKDDKPVTLNYLMRQNDAGVWQIQDVYLDATISELATRRAEFSAIVQREGVPALLTLLANKKTQLQGL